MTVRSGLSASTPAVVGDRTDVIDFRIERERHEQFFAREDVLAEIDRQMLGGGAARRWLLITGGPGMGKSALLARWLDRQERLGKKAPHHFLRRGVSDWDRPEVVAQSLSAQIEAMHPAQADSRARPEGRLLGLLDRVSREVLAPTGTRLAVVVDGLDEAMTEAIDMNPLPRFLPHTLPPGVFVLCASRPTYPHLDWLEARDHLRRIDLDAPVWSASNAEACSAFWAYHGPRFIPPLGPELTGDAVASAQGNFLHAVKLREWLAEQPVGARRAWHLPKGLKGFLGRIWEELRRLPREQFDVVVAGLGLLAAAREALPLTSLEEAAGWTGIDPKESFLTAARPFLHEELESWSAEPSYRTYHESFRDYIAGKLGPRAMREHHARLLETVARWPQQRGGAPGTRRYALRHAIEHAIAADRRDKVEALCRDVGFLVAKSREHGALAVEEDLRHAASMVGDHEIDTLYRAIRAESHWLREAPEALPGLLYNRLRSSGWSQEQIEHQLRFAGQLPALRLRHPVRMAEAVERTFVGHADGVTACAVTPDGRRVLSASEDRTLKLWDLMTGRDLLSLVGHEHVVTTCAVAPDGKRAVSGSYRALKVWDLVTGKELLTLTGHSAWVRACAVTPNGRRAVSASEDRTLKVWDLDSGTELATLAGHMEGVRACAVMPDGRRVVSASEDGTLKLWDMTTGAELATLSGHDSAIWACAVTPDGARIVSGAEDRTLRVWDAATGHVVVVLSGHDAGVNACAMTPDGQCVVSASEDRTLRLWDLTTGRELTVLTGHASWVSACAITPDGRRLVAAYLDRLLKVWDLTVAMQASRPAGHESWIWACAATPEGQRMVTASDDRTLRVWDAETGSELLRLTGHTDAATSCAITRDAQRILSMSRDRMLRAWDVSTGAASPAHRLGHGGWMLACVADEDRDLVLVSGLAALELVDVASGRTVGVLAGHSAPVVACAATPDGKRAISASLDRTLKIWDLATRSELATLRGHTGEVVACAVTPDGARVLSASFDMTLILWDIAERREVLRLRGHTDRVWACAVLPDGKRAVSASLDKSLRLWDLTTGACVGTTYGGNAFLCVTAARDLLFAGDKNGNLWTLEVSAREPAERSSAPVKLFCSCAPEDEPLLDALEKHLSILQRQGSIMSWCSRLVSPGQEIAAEVQRQMDAAEIVLLLLSPALFASELRHREVVAALERQRTGRAHVLPILIRPVDLYGSPLLDLQIYPCDHRAVTQWANQDEAWLDVVQGIRAAAGAVQARRTKDI
ncbi:TIR domain-containing protein [Sorangium sp. So ce1014]|uniref:TIR domain-containing protein n=1 Tax=Sorangium sp. So ce1014 TaxID=3133326 RepID=UPI003F644CE8